jgi:hypothetical protein
VNLGNVLRRVREEDPVTLLGDRLDLTTLARAQQAAQAAGESLPEYIQNAVHLFDRKAPEDAWTQIIARLQDGEPAVPACLEAMLRFRLDSGE